MSTTPAIASTKAQLHDCRDAFSKALEAMAAKDRAPPAISLPIESPCPCTNVQSEMKISAEHSG